MQEKILGGAPFFNVGRFQFNRGVVINVSRARVGISKEGSWVSQIIYGGVFTPIKFLGGCKHFKNLVGVQTRGNFGVKICFE